ncbi:TPA: phage tail protein I [Klebsiella pneumoniae]|uniref:phage tail protein I n=1 Tax=Klebsiella pneumoniae TaxID=573 RepID=UPI001C58E026|nr:phage tail protein I [Klebsiella pneumoniae]HDU4628818.1 phage tail protein I [Klebsiella pneumoniae subsp. pneumoniae]MBW3309444.1 phage tail protein I [Klebsiella pneumoniae]MEB5718296.1 phage tail protein I [Klebsiella pneumoniae]MEB5799270.1 phage tail protein I [Klebsiella pneumoniae]HBT5618103.1 phage tail protein I [Klebsiella pneumoniae]
MTANYPASILPPNATAVERAIDRASAAALAKLPVYLIRWVKDPDSCPLALLPWLAWEYQVDTWNINWSEQKKRDAIKRAHYIHRHRGTVAAVRRALVDSPFGTNIVEWFNQNPKGDPYTFRLNVYQNDLPVTEYDQQDLKLAVLRARNLRSWFSVHVFGRLQGTSYAAGYMYATEKITPRFVPLQVVLSRYELNLAPGDSETVTVTILPEYAEDKTFTVTTSDKTIATARIVNGAIVVTGKTRGTCSVTVTTTNGVSAVIGVKVVAVMKFITRIDKTTRPLFFVRMDEDFTVDYGDGIDSRDYRFDPASAGYGWVIPTRDLVEGEEYTITIKNTETACLQTRLSNVSSKLNTVVELISVTGDRDNLSGFALDTVGLLAIRPGAFDDLPNVNNCKNIFTNCSSLTGIPASLFAHMKVGTFMDAFRGCISLTEVPAALFANQSDATDFSSVFAGCTGLINIGNNLFNGCASAVNFNYAFDGCSALTNIGSGIFKGCVLAAAFSYTFRACKNLLALPSGMFSDVPGGAFTGVFQNCAALTELPAKLFTNCADANHFGGAFTGCSQLLSVPDGLFAGLSKVTYFGSVFSGCSSLKTVGTGVFAGCALAQTFSSAFYACRSLETVAKDIFKGCVEVTTFASTFYGCSSLTALPSFADCAKVTTFSYAFANCESLTKIDADAFADKALVTTFTYAFVNCTSLVSVGGGAFRGCSALTSLGYTFSGCRSLVSLAGDMFAGCVKVTAANFLFNQCSALANLPKTLFSDMISLTGMWSTFQDCTALISLPSGLLEGCVNLTSLTLTFSGCTSLAVLPGDLLKNNTLLTSAGSTFYGCTSLVNIPPALFASCSLITSFGATFQNTGVEEIPENLFSGNPLVTSYGQTFSGCKNLRSVPAGLFAASINATVFTNVFSGCSALEVVGAGLLNTTAVTTVGYLFDGCASLRSDVNAIFNLASYPEIVTTTAIFRSCALLTGKGLVFMGKVPNVTAHYYAFYACAGLDDYDDLPGNWITNKL